jgi:hypothetical protein
LYYTAGDYFSMMRIFITILAFALASRTPAQDGDHSWLEMAALAVQQSKLTLAGSSPFHLKAEIVETTNPTSEYQAKVEEFWISPEKWQRTIESPGFSQTMVVNGDKLFEKDTGDYFPWWLDNAVTAIVDPLPALVMPSHVDPRAGQFVPSQVASLCTGVRIAGDPWSVCFDPRHVLLTNVFSKNTGYGADFKNFRAFGKQQVPRQIVFHPEPGTTIEANITQLVEVKQVDEQMFAVEQSTPPQDRIARVRVDQDTLRKISITSTEIAWPVVDNGPITGGCAVYVSVDRGGHMREVWPGGCDNGGLEDPLRDMIKKWQLKPATTNGVPVQIESRLTFDFKTSLKSNSLQEAPH